MSIDSVPEQGRGEVSPVEHIPEKASAVDLARGMLIRYRFTLTTGPFALPSNTHSLDWVLLNDDPAQQTARVTVFKCMVGQVKTAEPPGPLEVTLDPGECTHNANNAIGGFIYEVIVQCNSRRVLPYATAWPGSVSDPLPGSVVNSGDFVRLR